MAETVLYQTPSPMGLCYPGELWLAAIYSSLHVHLSHSLVAHVLLLSVVNVVISQPCHPCGDAVTARSWSVQDFVPPDSLFQDPDSLNHQSALQINIENCST